MYHQQKTSCQENSLSKIIKPNLVWKVKNHNDETTTLRDTVIPTAPKVECPRKVVPNPRVIEYDYWIDERTMAFCLFPKESRNKSPKSVVAQKSQPKPKTRAFVPKPNSEPKNSTTH